MGKYEAGEFSVCQFFEDGTNEYVRRWVSAEEAMKAAEHYTRSIAARIGVVKTVIVTDGSDLTNFEWRYGEGVVFPTKEQCEELKRKDGKS